jgi:hypothetical protein
MEPVGEREPVQPSPGFPSAAEQESVFFELQVSATLCPAVCVESLLDSVTLGVATLADVAATATKLTVACAVRPLQLTW